MSVPAAFTALARGGLMLLMANEAAFSADANPESVHQMRVAIRRLRALLANFAPRLDAEAVAFLQSELRWLQDALAPMREWDVLLSDSIAPLARRLPQEAGLAKLRAAAAEARHQSCMAGRAALRDRRYERFLLRFQLWLDMLDWQSGAARREKSTGKRVKPFAAKVLAKRYRKLIALGARDDLAESQMHKLRLRAKKLHDAVDFFRPLYRGKGARRFEKALVVLQGNLGVMHDAKVSPSLVTRIARPRESDLAAAAKIVMGFDAARVEGELRHFKRAWRQFADLKTFWRKSF